MWKVVHVSEDTQPAEDTNKIPRKWKIKDDKAMFVLKTTIEEDVFEHIQDVSMPKEAWDTQSFLKEKWYWIVTSREWVFIDDTIRQNDSSII